MAFQNGKSTLFLMNVSQRTPRGRRQDLSWFDGKDMIILMIFGFQKKTYQLQMCFTNGDSPKGKLKKLTEDIT